jgi:diguanylate cyclase (GGDEF)-like protein
LPSEPKSRLRHQRDPALLLADLDSFAVANDEFGHHGGDLLLTQIVKRLREPLEAGNILARVGGDEFAVLLTGAAANNAADISRGLLAALDAPFTVGDLDG